MPSILTLDEENTVQFYLNKYRKKADKGYMLKML